MPRTNAVLQKVALEAEPSLLEPFVDGASLQQPPLSHLNILRPPPIKDRRVRERKTKEEEVGVRGGGRELERVCVKRFNVSV